MGFHTGIGWLLPGLAATPYLHPMLVHFPVALFPLSLFLALLALRPSSRLAGAARLTFLLAAGSMIPAVAAGLRAQRFMVHGPGTLVSVHRAIMLTALGLSLLLSIIVFRRRGSDSVRARLVFMMGLCLINAVVLMGADRGALIAFRLRTGESLGLPSVRPPAGGEGREEGPPGRAAEQAPGDSARGRIIYRDLGCDGCHGDARRTEGPGLPPTLAYAGSKLRPEWTALYLRRPYRIRWLDVGRRPITRMPDFQLDSSEAKDLAAWLAGREDPGRFPADPTEKIPAAAADVELGRNLVAQYACRGCHEFGGAGNRLGPSLDGVGARLRPAYLRVFLTDPRAVIPGTDMPNFHPWKDETRALTAYLATLTAAPSGVSGHTEWNR